MDMVNGNKGVMTEEMILSMDLRTKDTEARIAHFEKHLADNYATWSKKNPGIDREEGAWYPWTRRALWSVFKWDVLLSAICSYVAELSSLFYSFLLLYILKYLKDDCADWTDGVRLVSIFAGLIFVSNFIRNYYVFNGLVMGVRLRKTLVGAMFNKVGRMSLKSMARTNSGKLVALISADIMQIERPVTLICIAISGGLLNITVFVIIGLLFKKWIYVVFIAGVWVVMLTAQIFTARKMKDL
jgi:ABC-type multidrug transport system fused ATPase/permease subunit